MKKINVIGTSGSGKSHFSRRLAAQLDVPYIEMDALFWLPNWQHLSTEDFLSTLQTHMKQDAWVLDGNQSKTNSLKWQYVDTIIWLDYGFFRTFKQVLLRSIKRSISKTELWPGTGNTESFQRNFLPSKSVILWMLQNYWKTRRKYSQLFASESLQHNKQLIRLTCPNAAEKFLTNVIHKDIS